MIPLDKKRLNVTLVPALIAQLDSMAGYWGVHRSTIIAATINAGLPNLQDMRDNTSTSPDKGKAKLRDLAATQLELPLGCPPPRIAISIRTMIPDNARTAQIEILRDIELSPGKPGRFGLQRACRRATAYQGSRELSVLTDDKLNEEMETVIRSWAYSPWAGHERRDRLFGDDGQDRLYKECGLSTTMRVDFTKHSVQDAPNGPALEAKMNNTRTPVDLQARIVELVNEFWREHQVPILLSRLGTQENGEIGKLAKECSGSLGEYLRRELSQSVRIIRHSSVHAVIGVVPSTVDVEPNQIDELLEKTKVHRETKVPRFHPALWAAFRKPLEESKRRYFTLGDSFYFQDLGQEAPHENAIAISAEYISDSDAGSGEVVERLQKWLADKGIRRNDLIQKNRQELQRLPENDVLSLVLNALNVEDLKRISMPLDVVMKLRKQAL